MIETFIQTDWIGLLTKVLLATALGYLMGMERELHGKAVGRRTISLIVIGSMLYVLMSPSIMGGDNSRVIAQVVSGIGFLGAGIILVKNNSTVAGLTTAAGMWVTATIGVAFGYGFYGGGILATVICVVNAALLTKIEHKRIQALRFYVEVNDIEKIQSVCSTGNNKPGILSAAMCLAFTKDDKHVFCGSAGDNSVTMFNRDAETGLLDPQFNLPISGELPKEVVPFPDGKHLVSVNHESGTLTFFRIDYEKKLLVMSSNELHVDQPNSCVIVPVEA